MHSFLDYKNLVLFIFIMGCCCARNAPNSAVEDRIFDFESRIGLEKIKAKDFHLLVHKLQTNHIITLDNYFYICNELQIVRESLAYDFFMITYRASKDSFFSRELILSAILFCAGDLEEKAILLFLNYDTDSPGVLDALEIKTMIRELLTVVFNVSISLYMKKNNEPEESSVANYRKDLNRMMPFMLSYFLALILEGNEKEISLKHFKVKFKKPELEQLIFPHNLRLYCKDIWALISKNEKMVSDVLDIEKNYNSQYRRTLTIKAERRRKKREAGKK